MARVLPRIAIPGLNRPPGGPRTFVENLAIGLEKRGVEVTFALDDPRVDAILVVGGTRGLIHLLRAKRRGVRIVQRLGGLHWLHRVLPTKRRFVAGAVLRNHLMNFIRRRVASHVVYQSDFSRDWWTRAGGSLDVQESVITNGVDLRFFRPRRSKDTRLNPLVALVEGRIGNDHEKPLQWTVAALDHTRRHIGDLRVQLAGELSSQAASHVQDRPWITSVGAISRRQVAELLGSAACYVSVDVNPACPNALLEAMASGAPVVAFDTGAVPELLRFGAGVCVDYRGNPWLLEQPDIGGLARGIRAVLDDTDALGVQARRIAEKEFDIELMIDKYMEVLMVSA